MIEFKSPQKPRIAILLDNSVEVTFKTNKSAINALEALKDKEYSVSIKEYKPKRSLSQNSYMWVLLNELAIKLNLSKEEVYKSYIKDYGTYEILPIKENAVDSFINKWTKNGLGWFCEDLGESKLNGFKKLVAYFGSSTYTSAEMQRVINAIVYDCEQNGISTLTFDEIMRLQNCNDTE